MLFTPESPDLACHECWDEEYWTEMTDADWEDLYQKSFFEGIGGD